MVYCCWFFLVVVVFEKFVVIVVDCNVGLVGCFIGIEEGDLVGEFWVVWVVCVNCVVCWVDGGDNVYGGFWL